MSPDSLLAIGGMALVTWLTRVAGPPLVRLVHGNQRLKRCLDTLPGSILAALLAPLVFAAGPAEVAGAAVSVLTFLASRNMPLTLLLGVGTVSGARFFLGL